MKKSMRKSLSLLLAAVIIFSSVGDVFTANVFAKPIESENAITAETAAEDAEELEVNEDAEETDDETIAETEEIEEDSEDASDDIVSLDELIQVAPGEFVVDSNGYAYKGIEHEVPISNYANEESIEAEVPSAYDSRTGNGYVTSIKNQGQYGTCWAHSTMAQIEADMLRKGYAEIDTENDTEPDLSERHLAWFYYNSYGIDDPQGNTANDWNKLIDKNDSNNDVSLKGYDAGGNPWEVSLTLAKWVGVADEEDYPYSPYAGTMDGIDMSQDDMYTSEYHFQNSRFISFEQPDDVKRAIMTHGVLEVSYNHQNSFLNRETGAYYFPPLEGNYTVNHSVSVIGWDDDYSKDNFDSVYIVKTGEEEEEKHCKPESDGAWLIRNSWGAHDLNDGYMWLSYEDMILTKSHSSAQVFEGEPVDNYDNNYFYDGGNVDKASDKVKAVANVFTANSNEELEAIGIFLAASDVDYSIQIYKNPTDESDPTSGEAMLSEPQVGRTDYAGYYTIPLKETVYLSEGDEFAVVFSSDDVFWVFVDTTVNWEYEDTNGDYTYTEVHTSYAKAGQSYAVIEYSNGKWGWCDCNEGYEEEQEGDNLRIHAYTNNAKDDKCAPTDISFTNLNEKGEVHLVPSEFYDVRTKLTFDNPEANNYEGLVWKSSNESIAYVDSRGQIRAIDCGVAEITATSKLDASVKNSFIVRVYNLEEPFMSIEGVNLDYCLAHDFDTDKTYTCEVNPAITGYVANNIKWYSSNPLVAEFVNDDTGSVNTNQLKILCSGITTISAEVDGVSSVEYTINVCPNITVEPNFLASLKFSGQLDVSWSGSVSKVLTGYRLSGEDPNDSFGEYLYDTWDYNEYADYSFTIDRYKGKATLKGDIKLSLAGLFDYYNEDGELEKRSRNLRAAFIDKNNYNTRYVSVAYDPNYPGGQVPNYLLAEYRYDDKSQVSSPHDIDDFNKDYFDGYEFEGWECNGDSDYIVQSGDIPSEAFGDIVVIEYGQWGDSWNQPENELKAQWSPKQVEDITASLSAGQYDSGTKIRLYCGTSGADIYYTLDGSDPDPSDSESSTVKYNGVIVLNNDSGKEDITVRAVAVKDGYLGSNMFSRTYKIVARDADWGDVPESIRDRIPYGSPDALPVGMWEYGADDLVYTGSVLKESNFYVFYGKTLLKEGTDYTLKYSNNVNANTQLNDFGSLTTAQRNKLPTITITGKGSYSGTEKVYFRINQRNVADGGIDITNTISNLANASNNDCYTDYGGTDDHSRIILAAYNPRSVQKIMPVIKTTVAGKTVTLKNKTDYTVEFIGSGDPAANAADEFKAPGTYKVKVSFTGNYTGDLYYYVVIKENVVMMNSVTVGRIANQPYTGGAIIVDNFLTVKKGTTPLTVTTEDKPEEGNYFVLYDVGTIYKPGTATGILVGTQKEYNGVTVCGEKVFTFKIDGTAMNKVKVSGIPNTVEYKGEAWTLKDSEFAGVTLDIPATTKTPAIHLEEGNDYEVTYDKNTNAGTANIIFTGINGYTGSIKKTFKIASYKVLNTKVDAGFKNAPASGLLTVDYSKAGCQPEVCVKFTLPDGSSQNLTEGVDYKLQYTNNKAVNDGSNPKKMPYVKITGKGNFTGTTNAIEFAIAKKDLSDSSITMSATDTLAGSYNSTIALYDGKTKLAAGTDYDRNITYTYARGVDVSVKKGTKTIAVRRDKGTLVQKGDIVPAGTEIRVTVSGIKNYEGTKSVVFRVSQYNIARTTAKPVTTSYAYTGRAIEPDINDLLVTFKNGTQVITLDSSDFEIIGYANNVAPGTGTITIRGLNKFCGTQTVKFKIVKQKLCY